MVKKLTVAVSLLVILIVIVLIVAFLFTSYGTEQTEQAAPPGVHVGDVFSYDITGLWNSIDPSATMSPAFSQLNQTEYFKITITQVDESKVSFNTTWRFTNGTEVGGTGTINVSTGIYSPIEGFGFIYPANLHANDRTRPTGPDRTTVNETLTRTYTSGVARATNRLSLTFIYYDTNDPTYTTTYTELSTVYFDQQTGMLVEFRSQSLYNDPDVAVTIIWRIKESTVWQVS
jgi:hypothetical protein